MVVSLPISVALLATCPHLTLPLPETPGRGSRDPTAMSAGEALIENRWMNRLRVEKVEMCNNKKKSAGSTRCYQKH